MRTFITVALLARSVSDSLALRPERDFVHTLNARSANQLQEDFQRVGTSLEKVAQKKAVAKEGDDLTASSAAHTTRCNWANATVERDVRYGDDFCVLDSCQNFDFYPTRAAARREHPVPFVLYVHGGGWRAGTKCDIPPQVLDMRQRGWHVASINYRLAKHPNWQEGDPFAVHPDLIEDVKMAILYFKGKAAEYNLDPEKIILVGSSAGGHLVSLAGTGTRPFEQHRVAAVVNFFGPTDLFSAWDERIENMLNCTGNHVENTPCWEAAKQASPITHVRRQSPPFLTFFGIDDGGYPAAGPFQEAGDQAGADFTLYSVPCETDPCHNRQTMLSAESLTDTGMKCNTDILYEWMADKVSWHNTGCSPSPCERRDDVDICG